VDSLFLWLEQSSIASAIRESALLFPWIESVHVLAITAVVGTIAIVDLRLLGIASRDKAVSTLMVQILPFTRAAFAVAALTGVLLYVSHASDYMHKAPFVAKLVLLVLALMNILTFHGITARAIGAWDSAPSLPGRVKFAGGASLALWIAIVACGRWVGFV